MPGYPLDRTVNFDAPMAEGAALATDPYRAAPGEAGNPHAQRLKKAVPAGRRKALDALEYHRRRPRPGKDHGHGHELRPGRGGKRRSEAAEALPSHGDGPAQGVDRKWPACPGTEEIRRCWAGCSGSHPLILEAFRPCGPGPQDLRTWTTTVRDRQGTGYEGDQGAFRDAGQFHPGPERSCVTFREARGPGLARRDPGNRGSWTRAGGRALGPWGRIPALRPARRRCGGRLFPGLEKVGEDVGGPGGTSFWPIPGCRRIWRPSPQAHSGRPCICA
jgi:hypothetical protein